MASATKKAKLDSNGVAQKEIAGLYDKPNIFAQCDGVLVYCLCGRMCAC